MNIAITGASGFLGRRLTRRLQASGHTVRAVSLRQPPTADMFSGCDAVVNLAGEKVAQRWSPEVRARIESSRVEGTRDLIAALREHPPKVLVNGSAVGYYGSRGEETLEESAPPGIGFLANVTRKWEREALAAEQFGTRVVLLRTGIALGPDGGALQRMLLPFRWGLGGPIAGGRHWMPWIHAEDAVALIEFAIDSASLSGPVNAVAPNPVRNSEFTRELAHALHRPAIFPIPAFALDLLFGEMSEILTDSQRVIPRAALDADFVFRFPELRAAFADLFLK
ncbi:MAG TPA: TIGR01777 family oxidoreductase [Bryobacteraceae bacterium]|jgi:hypothetical protein|nr:TIGR01777 family oxidoreductase [Bryobacteraceae bacterium]